MKRVVIFGYFGCGNLGDETSLKQLVGFIRAIDPHCKITVISASPGLTATNLGVQAVGKLDLTGIWKAFQAADLLIGGGGSLFQDRTSLRSLIYYAALIRLGKLCRLKIFLYGQGIGPIRTRLGRFIASRALTAADVITARDRLSIIALAELNVRRPEIHIAAEPLLLREALPVAAVDAFWRGDPASKPLRLGLILQEYPALPRDFWGGVLEFLCWSKGLEIYLISLCERDQQFQKELATRFKLKLLPVVSHWEDLQKVVGGLDLLASSRLHGLVAAVVQGSACYGLAVDPKIEGFCLQLGVDFSLLEGEMEPLALSNQLLEHLNRSPAERLAYQAQLAFWKARARENQAILKQFII